MDKLIAIKEVIGILILCIIFPACTQTVNFIYLDEVLKKHPDSLQQQLVDLDHFLYLSAEVAEVVNRQYPGLLAKRHNNLNDFVIDEKDKLTVNLTRKYQRIESLVKSLDPQVVRMLKNNLGVQDPKKYLKERILIYNNSAFLEFVAPGSVHAVTLELKEGREVLIGLAFIIVN